MPLIAYTDSRMAPSSRFIVAIANKIIARYLKAGYRLTLRQLYYQFVSLGKLENTVRNYKRLGSIISDARLQGLIDWHAIEDRTRRLNALQTFSSPRQAIRRLANGYISNLWRNQPYELEIWVEKEALAGVVARTANVNRIPFLCCRGYTSQSEMWEAAMRLKRRIERRKKQIVILHLGDHDPSGIDMSRDIRDRLRMFMGAAYDKLTFKRVALIQRQIERFNPPPNPAKTTDSRYRAYRAKYGDESWELDALSPRAIDRILNWHIDKYRDVKIWELDVAKEKRERELLKLSGNRWDEVTEFLQPTEEF